MSASDRFVAAVLAGDADALAALASLRKLPPAEALALLLYLTEGWR